VCPRHRNYMICIFCSSGNVLLGKSKWQTSLCISVKKSIIRTHVRHLKTDIQTDCRTAKTAATNAY